LNLPFGGLNGFKVWAEEDEKESKRVIFSSKRSNFTLQQKILVSSILFYSPAKNFDCQQNAGKQNNVLSLIISICRLLPFAAL